MFNMSLKFDSHFTSFENTLDTIVMDFYFRVKYVCSSNKCGIEHLTHNIAYVMLVG